MSDVTIDTLEAEYRANFARRPRATRNLSQLDGLLARLAALNAGDTAARAEQLRAAWSEERTQIASLQAGGDHNLRAWRASALADMLGRRYARHYAGQSRRSRDAAMLREMAARLSTWNKQSAAVAAAWDHPVWAEQRPRHAALLTSFQQELTELPTAFTSGSPEDQAGALAWRANAQNRWYRLCFAGKNRSTRRLGLLQRIADELGAVHAQMLALRDAGYAEAAHAGNIGIVSDGLALYHREIDAVRGAIASADPSNTFAAIAGEANAAFDAYRKDFAGRPFTNVNLEALADLCDTLTEIALHMDELDTARPGAGYDRNLAVVLENLSMYEDTLARARQSTTPAA